MPELPDLTVFSENLTRTFQNRKLTEIKIQNIKKCDNEDVFQQALLGKTLTEVKTVGKEMLFYFEDSNFFSVHLMLHGGTEIAGNPDDVKYKTATFKFDNDLFLVIYDVRRWTKVLCNPEMDNVPDALTDKISITDFKNAFRRYNNKPVKSFLIDQSIMKGIGNAYADEILYACQIAPESVCGKIPESVVENLHRQIPLVLQWGVDEIKKVMPDATSGEGRVFMKVHNKEKTTTDTGFPIIIKDVAGKTTYYTEEQTLYI